LEGIKGKKGKNCGAIFPFLFSSSYHKSSSLRAKREIFLKNGVHLINVSLQLNGNIFKGCCKAAFFMYKFYDFIYLQTVCIDCKFRVGFIGALRVKNNP
ncbi:MAG: hypothetical protein IKI25_10085, partial [Bacteroidales bacterium]|nr:hypothetical protein [Bacteroidales bacterium]